MATSPSFVGTPNTQPTSFTNADGTNVKTIFTAGANGSRLEMLFATSNDTTARYIQWYIKKSGVAYPLDLRLIGAASATLMKNINLIDPSLITAFDDQNPGFILDAGCSLEANITTTVTSGKTISIFAFGGDF